MILVQTTHIPKDESYIDLNESPKLFIREPGYRAPFFIAYATDPNHSISLRIAFNQYVGWLMLYGLININGDGPFRLRHEIEDKNIMPWRSPELGSQKVNDLQGHTKIISKSAGSFEDIHTQTPFYLAYIAEQISPRDQFDFVKSFINSYRYQA